MKYVEHHIVILIVIIIFLNHCSLTESLSWDCDMAGDEGNLHNFCIFTP